MFIFICFSLRLQNNQIDSLLICFFASQIHLHFKSNFSSVRERAFVCVFMWHHRKIHISNFVLVRMKSKNVHRHRKWFSFGRDHKYLSKFINKYTHFHCLWPRPIQRRIERNHFRCRPSFILFKFRPRSRYILIWVCARSSSHRCVCVWFKFILVYWFKVSTDETTIVADLKTTLSVDCIQLLSPIFITRFRRRRWICCCVRAFKSWSRRDDVKYTVECVWSRQEGRRDKQLWRMSRRLLFCYQRQNRNTLLDAVFIFILSFDLKFYDFLCHR